MPTMPERLTEGEAQVEAIRARVTEAKRDPICPCGVCRDREVLLAARDAERATRVELEAARARLQAALDEATRIWRQAEARAEQAERERDEARDSMRRDRERDGYQALVRKWRAAEAREARLRGALDQYGQHTPACQQQSIEVCACGLDAALAAPAGGLLDAVREAAEALKAIGCPVCTGRGWREWTDEEGCPQTAACSDCDGTGHPAFARTARARLAGALGEGT